MAQQTIQMRDKKILLTAFSVSKTSEAMVLCDYLKQQGCDDITTLFWGGEAVAQKIPSDIKKIEISSPRDIAKIDKSGYDIVFRHQTVHPDDVQDAKMVMTPAQLFFEECRLPIIGVTGTKGKGTTSTLVSKILENAGIKNWLVGNVGIPALSVLSEIDQSSEGVVVCELSSFQLWDMKKSPETAIVLMIEPDHLDVHKSFEEYIEAKKGITKYQSQDDWAIFHPINQYSRQIAEVSPARVKKRYQTSEGAHVESGRIVIDGEDICAVDEVGLIGEHNLQNICAAVTAAWRYAQDTEAIRRAIKEFGGLDHRLKFVRDVRGVRYFDDSISTTPGSAIAALQAFSAPKIIILGGSSKGADFSQLAEELESQNIKKALLIGDEADRLASQLSNDKYEILRNTTMPEIVQRASQLAESGDVVILSPACASFGMFKNYQDRGNQFIEAVNNL